MQREIALACVASFETGNLDVDPNLLQDVIAISSGNTIYATETIFQDPCHSLPFHRLRHVVGNVGKPGLGLLISSQRLESPEMDPNHWQLIDERPFDGKYENYFRSTSLHLSLTGFEQALNTGCYGARDIEHSFLEVVISAYEGGTRVADLDLLSVTRQIQISGMTEGRFEWCQALNSHPQVPALLGGVLRFPPESCEHEISEQLDSTMFGDIISLDNWFEVLDPPSNSAIIRARGNALARLALAAICVQKKMDCVVFSEHVCWACASEALGFDQADTEEQFFFLC